MSVRWVEGYGGWGVWVNERADGKYTCGLSVLCEGDQDMNTVWSGGPFDSVDSAIKAVRRICIEDVVPALNGLIQSLDPAG